jgi:hypothetical protein
MSTEMEKIKKEEFVVEFTIIYYLISGRTEENKEYSQASSSIIWSRYDPKTYVTRCRTTEHSTVNFGLEF